MCSDGLRRPTLRPYRHWKKITPTDHTSTLFEIFGGSLPTTKHSGGKYLKYSNKIIYYVMYAKIHVLCYI